MAEAVSYSLTSMHNVQANKVGAVTIPYPTASHTALLSLPPSLPLSLQHNNNILKPSPTRKATNRPCKSHHRHANLPLTPTSMPLTIDPSDTHTHTIIFLHGRGSTPSQLAAALTRETPDSRGRSLVQALPTVRWVFPAPPASAEDPPTPNPASTAAAAAAHHGTEWFPPRQRAQQLSGLRSSVSAIRHLIVDEASRTDGRHDCVIVMGFSQGAIVASHVLLHHDRPLAAVLCISGRLLSPAPPSLAEMRCLLREPLTPVNDDADAKPLVNGYVHDEPDDDGVNAIRQTPVLVQHCAADLVSPVENGKALRDALRRFGADVTWEEFPGGGHWMNTPRGVDGIINFLADEVGVGEVELTEQPVAAQLQP